MAKLHEDNLVSSLLLAIFQKRRTSCSQTFQLTKQKKHQI